MHDSLGVVDEIVRVDPKNRKKMFLKNLKKSTIF